MTSTRKTPQTWQKNPEMIQTSKVQYWQNGIMMTAKMSKTEAQEMVRDGFAFVISNHAIGALKNGQYAS